MLPRFSNFASEQMQLQWCLWSKNRKSLFLDLHSEPPKKNRDWLENPPWMKTYFLLNMGIFQPVMLVFRGCIHIEKNIPTWGIAGFEMGSPSANFMFSCQRPTWCYLRCPWHDGHCEGCGLCIMDVAIWPWSKKICCEKIVSLFVTTSFFNILCAIFFFVVLKSKAWGKNTYKKQIFIIVSQKVSGNGVPLQLDTAGLESRRIFPIKYLQGSTPDWTVTVKVWTLIPAKSEAFEQMGILT